jgi:LemA protein
MKRGNLTWVVVLGIIGIILFWGCNVRNGFAKGDQEIKEKLGAIQAQYQNRTDLYNSVIKVIEGSANFEKTTLKEVLEARAKATSVTLNADDPNSIKKFQEAQSQLQGSFSRLMAVAENYPVLKTTDQFQKFQTQIESMEGSIKTARLRYNEAVKGFNNSVVTIPRSWVAGMTGFKTREYYEADPESKNPPIINFNIK